MDRQGDRVTDRHGQTHLDIYTMDKGPVVGTDGWMERQMDGQTEIHGLIDGLIDGLTD